MPKSTKRPGFLGDTFYWFDTPKQEVALEAQARRADPSSGSARSATALKSYVSRIFFPKDYEKVYADRHRDYKRWHTDQTH